MDESNCPVTYAAEYYGDAPAFYTERETISFIQFRDIVDATTSHLAEDGVQRRDRIAILSANQLAYAAMVFSLHRLGATAMLLNARLTPVELRDQLKSVGAKRIYVDETHLNVCRRLDLQCYPIPDPDEIGDLREGEFKTVKFADDFTYESETIIFTSGSEGKPKGAILTYANHYYNALGSNENIPLTAGDCWLLSLPLYHVGGLSIFYRCTLAGAAVYITPAFDAAGANRLIDSGKITHLSLVPTMLSQLLDERGDRKFPDRLKAILLGGARTPQPLIERIRRNRVPVLRTYGMTETGSQLCTMSPRDSLDKLKTSGRSLPYREVGVVDDTGQSAPANAEGEIVARGKVMFRGYSDDSTRTVFNESGWFRTGDLGFLDSDGYLTVTGRKDEMIISGGENIHPREIEEIAEEFPEIRSCKVIGIADERWGERPILFVESDSSEDDVIPLLRALFAVRLARFKIPDKIVVIRELPLTSLGKIDTKALRDLSGRNA